MIIELNKDEYSQMMEEVYKDFSFVDTVCKDASRFYYPSQEAGSLACTKCSNFTRTNRSGCNI